MKIAFAKIANNQIPFDIKRENLSFSGNLKRINSNLVECKALISGNMSHNCDRCGEDIILSPKENLNLLISDGIYKDSEEKLEDVIEFFDGYIDLEEILSSEIEAFKSDYFYCKNCENL
ncbi:MULTISPECIES: hypothetical protein [unclassified Campylobacter]|uniref:hypothetical protein n=1 Tax=unclassified Campylobacter TaxID=2593542 RepID=UPI0014757BB1|nr:MULTISPECIES: hypothetical protein [unclassified Campylobacter]